MCDRTKAEVLARELCIEHYGASIGEAKALRNRVEDNWTRWIPKSIEILEILEKHND